MHNKDVFILYEDDRLKLPIYVADSLLELAEISGIYIKYLTDSYLRGSLCLHKYKVEKVDIREPADKFTEEEYKKYCKSEKLSVGSFSSLKSFAKYCYGEI